MTCFLLCLNDLLHERLESSILILELFLSLLDAFHLRVHQARELIVSSTACFGTRHASSVGDRCVSADKLVDLYGAIFAADLALIQGAEGVSAYRP